MMATDVLDKTINRRPFLCRLGLHRWRPVSVLFAGEKLYVAYRCARCPAEKTEAT